MQRRAGPIQLGAPGLTVWLTGEPNSQARGIADQLFAQGREAFRRLGPQLQPYREAKQELEQLSGHVAGTHPELRGPRSFAYLRS